MADRSAAFFICIESAFSWEGARGVHESAAWDDGIGKLDVCLMVAWVESRRKGS